MLYDNITTEIQLEEFVDRLNELSHWERYQLFEYAFTPKLLSLRPDGYKNTRSVFFEIWAIKIAAFGIYCTTKINARNPIENPEMRTGLYEQIYFHINPEDKGISQIST